MSSETRQTTIYELDATVKRWWAGLPENFRLTPASFSLFDRSNLTKVFFINTIYYQCLCALHASIVPLFSWGPPNLTTELAQQFSAQIAYSNACILSEILEMFLNSSNEMADWPSYLGFAAYSSFAIQIPFIGCLNPAVRERAKRNTAINLRVIRGMGQYWKFINLLVSVTSLNSVKILTKPANSRKDMQNT